jgi:hypothetical protein
MKAKIELVVVLDRSITIPRIETPTVHNVDGESHRLDPRNWIPDEISIRTYRRGDRLYEHDLETILGELEVTLDWVKVQLERARAAEREFQTYRATGIGGSEEDGG